MAEALQVNARYSAPSKETDPAPEGSEVRDRPTNGPIYFLAVAGAQVASGNATSEGYHLPSKPQRCPVRIQPKQAAACHAPGVQAAGAAAFFVVAAEEGDENDTAIAAIAATSATFPIVFMVKLPA